MRVGDDVRVFDLHAERFQAHVLDIADDAHGDDGDIGFQGFGLAAGLDLDGHAGFGFGQLLDVGRHAKLQAALLEGLVGGLGDLFILDRQDARQGFDHCNIRA